jgi:hypothetical protein
MTAFITLIGISREHYRPMIHLPPRPQYDPIPPGPQLESRVTPAVGRLGDADPGETPRGAGGPTPDQPGEPQPFSPYMER